MILGSSPGDRGECRRGAGVGRSAARTATNRDRWAMVGFSLSGCLLLIVPVAASGVDFRYLLPAAAVVAYTDVQ